MKKLIFVLIVLSAFCARAQQKESDKKETSSIQPKPLYILDGKIVSDEVINGKYTDKNSGKLEFPSDKLDPNDIERIDVLKGDSAVAKYGEAGKNGVVVIITKAHSKKSQKH